MSTRDGAPRHKPAAPPTEPAGAPAEPPVTIVPAPEKIPEPPGNLDARARAFAKRSGGTTPRRKP
ncbi:MAG: hypothetical protein JNJ60_04625 [Rhodocyclaceae bacterium]|nr:hypothetical protein [Rhodocyclaceae bacterium]